MTSRVWPPPTAEEEAIAAAVINNPFEEACEDCEHYPCICDQCNDCTRSRCICDQCNDCECDPCRCNECDDCGCDPCECDTCSVCKCVECECSEVYVFYNTTVMVSVDSDGDISYVRVNSDLSDGPYDVQYEDGDSVRHEALRERALEACRDRDWPNWDID